jgi:hypothetical protein
MSAADFVAVWAWRQNMLGAVALLPQLFATTVPAPALPESTDELLIAALHNHRQSITRSPILTIEVLEEPDALNRFRFTIDELKLLVVAFRLEMYQTVNRVTVSSLFALSLLLRRLTWSLRYSDLSLEFGYDDSSISHHVNHLLLLLVSRYAHQLALWHGVTRQRVVQYEQAIHQYSPAIRTIWCFLDGTLREIAKPVRHETICYSGYKRVHGFNYQSLVAPDGLIVSLHGPYPGSRNDMGVWHASDLAHTLPDYVVQGNTTYHIFGDKAYAGQPLIMTPFKPSRSAAQKLYNLEMAKLRAAVEQAYARTTALFTFTDVKRIQRSLLQPVGAYYHAMVLFTNVRTCLDNGNQISDTFELSPPSLMQYLDAVRQVGN